MDPSTSIYICKTNCVLIVEISGYMNIFLFITGYAYNQNNIDANRMMLGINIDNCALLTVSLSPGSKKTVDNIECLSLI
jgi:hypothetical protein